MNDFLQRRRGNSGFLRKLIAARETILAPGAYDALSARIFEQAGFRAVYMTGFGTAASFLGRSDVGLLTMSEMVDNASRISRAIDVPLIADADTGYGNPLNVIRTVHEEVPPKVVYTIDPGEARSLRLLTKAMCNWANYWASRTGVEIEHAVSGPSWLARPVHRTRRV